MFKSHVWLHSDTVMRLVSQSHVSSVTQGSARSVTCSHYYYRDHAGWRCSGEWGQMSGWCLCDIRVYMAVCDLCKHICVHVCLHISLYSDCSKKQTDLNDTSSRYDHFLACCHGYLLFMMRHMLTIAFVQAHTTLSFNYDENDLWHQGSLSTSVA